MKTALEIIFNVIGAIATRETVKTTSTVALFTDRVKIIAIAVTGIMGTSRETETGVGTKLITMGETATGAVIIWVKTVAEGKVLFYLEFYKKNFFVIIKFNLDKQLGQ